MGVPPVVVVQRGASSPALSRRRILKPMTRSISQDRTPRPNFAVYDGADSRCPRAGDGGAVGGSAGDRSQNRIQERTVEQTVETPDITLAEKIVEGPVTQTQQAL